VTPASPSLLAVPNKSAQAGALRYRIHGAERLARRHEQAVALRAAAADVAAARREEAPLRSFDRR